MPPEHNTTGLGGDMPASGQSADRSTILWARPALVTLLAVQIIIGWEWLASGITKIASGTFLSGLAASLKPDTIPPAVAAESSAL